MSNNQTNSSKAFLGDMNTKINEFLDEIKKADEKIHIAEENYHMVLETRAYVEYYSQNNSKSDSYSKYAEEVINEVKIKKEALQEAVKLRKNIMNNFINYVKLSYLAANITTDVQSPSNEEKAIGDKIVAATKETMAEHNLGNFQMMKIIFFKEGEETATHKIDIDGSVTNSAKTVEEDTTKKENLSEEKFTKESLDAELLRAKDAKTIAREWCEAVEILQTAIEKEEEAKQNVVYAAEGLKRAKDAYNKSFLEQ